MMNRQPRGFTLIELLVSISIMTLLISILLPSLSSAREQARSSVCLSNLKRLGMGIMIYLDTGGDRYPPFRMKSPTPDSDEVYVNDWGRAKPRWQWFVDSEEVGPAIDPDPFVEEIESRGWFGDDSTGSKGESGRQMTNRYFVCPSLTDEFELDIRNGAYGYNYQYLGNSRLVEAGDRWSNFPVGTNNIRAAGQTVLLADSRGAGKVHGRHSYSLDPPRLAVERGAYKFGPGVNDVQAGLPRELYRYSPVEMRHKNKGNVVFVDGHAKGMTLTSLGYQLNENGVAMPILDPLNGTYTASNKLWNGRAYDEIASKHRP